ncbi:hypothetical protein [Luteolibacter luteus]|uniref:DUF1570 domain-containing protein n=1 Tax=Luteolibacter luteus TaxID=2728835 RepID=A0A858RN11_9BACT|nr:hypothetical protein [Luteolibacter luteus]QJE98397.1 hypothetical protein HHL09_22280 [Luteolibacter luteus]
MRTLLFLFLLPLLAAAAPMPREFTPQPATLEQQADEEGRRVWHTRFFRIDSDMELPRNQLLRLAQVADTTALVLKSHPLPLFAPPEGQRSRIAIYANAADYVRAGGAHGSAGFYIARKALVLVRGDFLADPRNPAKSQLPPNYDEDIVVHELVHLCMHRQNAGLPQWLVEGLAEYFATAHEGGGRFSFADPDKSVREHLRSRLSPKNPVISVIRVDEVTPVDGRGWIRLVESLPEEERYQTYATALLLAHYHLHGGAERLEALKALLESPHRTRRGIVLLTPQAAPEAQYHLIRYWKPKGLTLNFRGVKGGQ